MDGGTAVAPHSARYVPVLEAMPMAMFSRVTAWSASSLMLVIQIGRRRRVGPAFADTVLTLPGCWVAGGLNSAHRPRRLSGGLRRDAEVARRTTRSGDRELAEKRAKDAEAKLRRFQAAIEAGIEPTALVEVINQAQAERAAARAELDNAPPPDAVAEAEVYAMIDSLGDVAGALTGRHPDKLIDLYDDLRIEVIYDNEKEAVDVTASPRVNSACVRGGT